MAGLSLLILQRLQKSVWQEAAMPEISSRRAGVSERCSMTEFILQPPKRVPLKQTPEQTGRLGRSTERDGSTANGRSRPIGDLQMGVFQS